MRNVLRWLIASILLLGSAVLGQLEVQSRENTLLMHSVQGALMSKVASDEAIVAQRRATPQLAANPHDRYLSTWLYSLRYLNPLVLEIAGARAFFTADELLFNYSRSPSQIQFPSHLPWQLLRAVHYDQIPSPVLEATLSSQLSQYGHLLDVASWPLMNPSDWMQVPAPIRKMAAYGMVWEWSRLRTLNSSEMTTGEAARILISIGLVESLFDLDKIDSRNPRTGNVDRGYFQISDPVRRSLARVPEFRSYNPGDYYRPWVSVQAASYHFFVKLLNLSRGDIHRAIGMYNAGPAGTREKAQGYFLAVVDRYGDTFIEQNRHSPTRYLMLRYAQPEYFRGIESDRLFTYGSRTALAMSRTAAPDEVLRTPLTSPQP